MSYNTIEKIHDSLITNQTPFDSIPISDIIKTLVISNYNLKQELLLLKNKKSNRKIVIDQAVPDMPFCKWVNSLSFDFITIENIFQNNFNDLLKYILKTIIKQSTLIPIKIYDSDSKDIYIYENDAWSKLTSNNLEILYFNIQKHIMSIFANWQNANISNLSDDQIFKLYSDNIIKLTSNKTNFDNVKSFITTSISSYL